MVLLVDHGIRVHLILFDLLWVTRLNNYHRHCILFHFLLVHLFKHVSLCKLLKLLLLVSRQLNELCLPTRLTLVVEWHLINEIGVMLLLACRCLVLMVHSLLLLLFKLLLLATVLYCRGCCDMLLRELMLVMLLLVRLS